MSAWEQKRGQDVKHSKLEAMPLNDLWKLNETVMSLLASKVEAQKRELERRLEKLGYKFGGSPNDIPQRRPYPKVLPKFRNPERPSEAWSGRRKQPRWVSELLAVGASLDDFRIQ
jgi:DNA-binding protein H-NS